MENCDTQIQGAITGTYACITKSDIQKYGFKDGLFEYTYGFTFGIQIYKLPPSN